MGKEFTQEYILNTYDFDKYYKVKMVTLMNFLQDIATVHFEHAVKQITNEIKNGLWVIVEWDVQMKQMPNQRMTLVVKTEPTYFRKFIAYRRYTIEDSNGVLYGEATSKWAYIDLETRKQLNIPQIVYELFDVPSNAEKPTKLQFSSFESLKIERDNLLLKSLYSDIDVNQHVNNVAYIRWAIDALYDSLDRSFEIKSLKVAFKKEVFEGEKIVVHSKFDVNNTIGKASIAQHYILNSNDERCVDIEITYC